MDTAEHTNEAEETSGAPVGVYALVRDLREQIAKLKRSNKWLKASARINREKREEATLILADIFDEALCSFDHHGYCQAHGWLTVEAECPHARAKRFIGI